MNDDRHLVPPGKYEAKVLDWGIISTKDGKPAAAILFGFTFDGKSNVERTWFGSFNEGKARQFTLDTLLTCGLKGNSIEDLAEGAEGNALEKGKTVSITIAHDKDDKGKVRDRVQWVNRLGGNVFRDRMSKDDVRQKFMTMNITGELMARRVETGIKDKPHSQESAEDDPLNQIPW